MEGKRLISIERLAGAFAGGVVDVSGAEGRFVLKAIGGRLVL